jgi:hypothetical protein
VLFSEHSSDSGIFRAKTANGGSSLRDDLAKVGFEVEVGRRKGMQITLWTSLSESMLDS